VLSQLTVAGEYFHLVIQAVDACLARTGSGLVGGDDQLGQTPSGVQGSSASIIVSVVQFGLLMMPWGGCGPGQG